MTTLAESRINAARITHGTSGNEIKTLILKLLNGIQYRSLLDFGAGAGELLSMLPQDRALTGVDILERPPHLSPSVSWIRQDLNEKVSVAVVDVVTCSEVIEHLENPRATFRNFRELLTSGGWLVLTTPNNESIRSYAALIAGGHFAGFLGASYPAHITALLRMDLRRIALESGFTEPTFHFTGVGGLPKLPRLKWQVLSFGLLRGRLFSDNVAMVCRKK